MRGKHDVCRSSPADNHLIDGPLYSLAHRVDVSGVVEEDPKFVDFGCAFADTRLRAGDILTILSAAGIRTEGGCHEGQCVLDSVTSHLHQGLRQHGVPVAVAPIDGQGVAMLGKLGLQRRDERSALFVDRADTAKMSVMFGDFEHSRVGDVLAAQYVFEERNDIVWAFGAAEGHEQNGIV